MNANPALLLLGVTVVSLAGVALYVLVTKRPADMPDPSWDSVPTAPNPTPVGRVVLRG